MLKFFTYFVLNDNLCSDESAATNPLLTSASSTDTLFYTLSFNRGSHCRHRPWTSDNI